MARLKSDVFERIVYDSLSPEPLSEIPLEKQDDCNIIMSRMLGEMFNALNGDGGTDYDVQMNDLTQILDHASLVFLKLGKSLRERHKTRKEFSN